MNLHSQLLFSTGSNPECVISHINWQAEVRRINVPKYHSWRVGWETGMQKLVVNDHWHQSFAKLAVARNAVFFIIGTLLIILLYLWPSDKNDHNMTPTLKNKLWSIYYLYLAYFEFLARIVTLKPFHPAQFTILGCSRSASKPQTLVDIATLTKVHISLRKSRWNHILFSVKFKSVFQYLTWTPLHVKYLLIAVLSANYVCKNWKTIV